MKTGIIDVGGGLRGIYAAGVLDYCMDKGIRFDLGIGISAGSANLASYAAGQKRRNYQFYTEYAFRKQYMGFRNFIFKRSFVDMDYVYGTLCRTGGENPLDYPALRDNPMEFWVVATDAQTGRAKYFNKKDIRQDNYDILKASSSIPFVCSPYTVQETLYFDGALGDPVPVSKAFELGCDRVVLILTKPKDEIRNSGKDDKIAFLIRKKYPFAAETLCRRASLYNEEVALAQRYEEQGRVLIIAPDDTCGVDTLKKDKAALQRLYEKGYHDAGRIQQFMPACGPDYQKCNR